MCDRERKTLVDYISNEHAAVSMQIRGLFFSPYWLKESSQTIENISRLWVFTTKAVKYDALECLGHIKSFWNGSRKVYKWFLMRIWKPNKYHREMVLFRLQKKPFGNGYR